MADIMLGKGEEVVFRGQGTIQYKMAWWPGFLILTNKRLVFIYSNKTIVESGLDKIMTINIIKRNWLMGVKVKQLCIGLNRVSGHEYLYVALKNTDEWVNMIKGSMTLMLVERWGCNGGRTESPGNT